MSNIPKGLFYTEEDEWIRVEDSEAVLGITDYAQDSLSDIVYVELPDVGDSFSSGDTFGVVESVKAASDVYAPLSGSVIAVNELLADDPEKINADPYGDGWIVRIQPSAGTDGDVMSPDEYQAFLDELDE